MSKVQYLETVRLNIWSKGHYNYAESARKFWKRWYFWAIHSRLKPIIDAAGTIKRHIADGLTWIIARV
jgi:transposase